MLPLKTKVTSQDGQATKYVWGFDGGKTIESVHVRFEAREYDSLCVSMYLSIEKWVSGAFGEAGFSLTEYNRRFLVSLPVALYSRYRDVDTPPASLAVRLPLGYHYGG